MAIKLDKLKLLDLMDDLGECSVCGDETLLVVYDQKGMSYICSEQCQLNYRLQCGMSGYNEVRHDYGLTMKTVGKLGQLDASELSRMFRFKHKISRRKFEATKKGDSIDKFLGIIYRFSRKRQTRRVQVTQPFRLTVPEDQYDNS